MFVAGFMGSPSMNFIPGELTKAEGRPAVAIALSPGETATLPLAQPLQSWPANGKIVLGVRPEHLFRYDTGLKSQKAGLAMLTAPVEVVEPTGAETMASRTRWRMRSPSWPVRGANTSAGRFFGSTAARRCFQGEDQPRSA
jgi:ABC-type sugar transport system ATPase subunit